MASRNQLPDIRLMLVGHTGDGKSATGNSILGKGGIFASTRRHQGQTEQGDWKTATRFGRNIEIVDTPGIYDPRFPHDKIQEELFRAVALTVPRLSAIAFVIRPPRITEETEKTIEKFTEWFGNDIQRFTFVIVTYTEDEDEVDEFLGDRGTRPGFLKYMGGKALPIENKWLSKGSDKLVEQVKAIIAQVDKLNPTGDAFSNTVIEKVNTYVANIDKKTQAETEAIVQSGPSSIPTAVQCENFKKNVATDKNPGFFSRVWKIFKRIFSWW